MRNIFKFAKFVYYFFFSRLAHSRLKRLTAKSVASSTNINLVCRYGVANGLSNGANYQYAAFKKLGFSVSKIDITRGIKNPFWKVPDTTDGVFIFHCAAPQFLQFAWPLRNVIKNSKLIGYFAWELAEPPNDWPNYPDIWDEIWTTSAFSAKSLSKLYTCPIRVVPHVLLSHGKPRVWLKKTESLIFLTMADARSSLSRKNPLAVIDAFRKAFPEEQDVELWIKLQINDLTAEVDHLFAHASSDKRIHFITKSLTRDEVDLLVASAHVYVSLHRAEGFGLPLLEARMAGLATVATAWSGNMDFMSNKDSSLISYTLVKMFDESGVYGEVTWADPDVVEASRALRRLYDDPAYLASISQAGWSASNPDNQLNRFADAISSL